MIIGVPKEIKDHEARVAVIPGGVVSLVRAGHKVLVETGAGIGSGITDEQFAQSGAIILPSAAQVFEQAEMILKVKEPQPQECALLHSGQVLFTYLHLAAEQELTLALVNKQVTAIGYETVQLANGSLPLLTPMSEIAGRMAVQIGAHFLEYGQGGRGVLLSGVPGVLPANVVILGGGTVGANAAYIALGIGARVTVIDLNIDRLRALEQTMHGNLSTVASNIHNITEAVKRAEVLIGAVLVTGAKAPVLVEEEMIASMAPGSVVVDVAVDQGGCIATIHPTSHSVPTYKTHGVVHYAVPNMPGAVPRTSTFALANVTLPYVSKLADLGFSEAVKRDSALRAGVNTHAGHVTYQAVADTFKLEYVPLNKVMD
ncbi:MAG: alanine dehydrogenase [Chloroflexi bacterium]|nr:alanine dehydrogenase [Chloroflexota bacterium]